MEAFFRREWEAAGGGVVFWVRLVGDHMEAAWAVRSRARNAEREGRMRMLVEEIRGAARTLARAPRFTAFAVVTLALGVGAVTAAFTVVDRVALRPLPYPGSERMVLVGIEPRHDPGSVGPLSPALLQALRSTPGPAEAVVAARTVDAVLFGEGDPERVRVSEVSRDFFQVFGARPAAGRLLRADDHAPGSEAVVVLGAAVWRDRYGGDPGIVGRTVRLDDELHTVVGVLDGAFLSPPEMVEVDDYWTPLRVDMEIRDSFFLAGAMRLRPGLGLDAADAHADAVVETVHAGGRQPDFILGASVAEYRDAVVGAVGRDLGRVLAAVGLLLIIACVNVAGLLLTRGAERRQELGVHFALGAGRPRLVRKLLWESALLAFVGGLVGGALAFGAVELFRGYGPPGLPRLEEVAVDPRGLLFALGMATAAVGIFGVLPALRSTRSVVGGTVASRSATHGPGESRLRGALVAAETALAVILVVGSALLAHDLMRVSQEDPGFRPEGLVAMTLNLDPRYERDEWVGVWQRILEHAEALPGVSSVAVATQAPWDGSRIASTYRPEGREDEEAIFAATVGVGGAYIEALGTRLVAGRAVAGEDGGGEPVAMVNESFVERFWPGEEGVGRVVHSGEEDEPVYRVVGVLADVRTRPGRPVSPHVFLPLHDAAWREMDVLVRTPSGGDVSGELREIVRRVDPMLPVTSIRTMESLSSESLSAPRFYATLFGGSALVALLLALVGVYGTTAYATRARWREVGIRMALGARRGQVVRTLVLRSGVAVATGVVVGLTLASLGSDVLAGALRYVAPRDGVTYVLVGSVVVAAGIVAAWIPAAAAGRADPMSTLREE